MIEPQARGFLTTQLKDMRERIKAITPRRSYGILTRQGTRGTTRTPLATDTETSTVRGDNVPRWG